MGSPRFRSGTTRTALATQAWFAPGATLAEHTHDRAIFAVMLDGSFDKLKGGTRLECTPGLAWTEPAGERHANFIGTRGANVIVIQPDADAVETLQPFAALLDAPQCFRHSGIVSDARRLALELAIDDPFSTLGIDALIVGMLTAASRVGGRRTHHGRPPRWLTRVQERLHAHGGGRVQLGELSAIAGVHPCHLVHVFRRHFHMTAGEYLRRVRLNAALERLADTDRPISEIAVATGFADQSHLTRTCRSLMGVTPAGFRQSRQGAGA